MAAPTCCSGAVTSAAGMKPVFPVLCHVLTAVLFPVLITSNDGKCCDATDFDQFVVHNILDV